MTGLLLVRHGATDLNLEGRCQGWIDPDLNGEGVRQARPVGAFLRTIGVRPTEVWSSDLVRARRTAELGLPDAAVRTDQRLRELAFGSWEGRRWDEIHSSRSRAFLGWAQDPEDVAPPGGETLAELRARLRSWAGAVGGWTVDFPGGPPDLARSAGPPTDAWRPLSGAEAGGSAVSSDPSPGAPPGASPGVLPGPWPGVPSGPSPGVRPGPSPEVQPRASAALSPGASPVTSTVVVAHGGPIRLFLARHLALPPAWEVESRLRVPPGAVILLGAGG